MGFLDSWRRKKHKQKVAKPRIVHKLEVVTLDGETSIPVLLSEYEKLFQRRETLQKERLQLSKQLDDGDLTALQFRKELKGRIQEAADVSDQLKVTAGRLISLGYNGTLQ